MKSVRAVAVDRQGFIYTGDDDLGRLQRFNPDGSLESLHYLATTWYENRLTVESRRPGPDEMVEIFARVGLEGPFWDPQADPW
ncbi:MAG TPA: hypothetical protein VFC23_09485 [Thermoanaerobaculia bacterium]|nr:hypothetical protein [Thermoanaerobaculia bacterium]